MKDTEELANLAQGRGWWRKATSILLFILPALVLGVLTFYVSQPVAIAQMAGEQAHVAPFTLHRDVYLFENGQREAQPTNVETLAMRSDGSIVRAGYDFGQVGIAAGYTSRFVMLWDGTQYGVADAAESVIPMPALPRHALAAFHQWVLSQPSNCVHPGEKLLGYGTFKGVRVARVESDPSGPNRTLTEWRAPSLGCAWLQYRAELRQTDGSLQTTAEGQFVSLKMGEPDPSLFTVPSGYTRVARPSESLKKEAEGLGLWNKGLAAYSARLDAAYNAKMLKAEQQP